jgi:hypothetical protein
LNVAEEVRLHQFHASKACDLEFKRNKKASLNVNGRLMQGLSADAAGPYIHCLTDTQAPREIRTEYRRPLTFQIKATYQRLAGCL